MMDPGSGMKSGQPPLRVTRQIDELCDELESHLDSGEMPPLLPLLNRIDANWRGQLLDELVELALDRLRRSGVDDPQRQLLDSEPEIADELKSVLARQALTVPHLFAKASTTRCRGLIVRCPYCQSQIEVAPDAELETVACPSCQGEFSLVGEETVTRNSMAVSQIGQFRLVERVGIGAFGSVWKAHDTQLNRTVAIKIPRRGQFDESQEKAFLREAQNAAPLSHPGIVPVYEVGRDGDTLYIVTEFIRGVSLAEMLASGRPTKQEAAKLCAEIADALQHAHEGGVIHRDLKPGNVMIADDGRARIMDFGVAHREASDATVTLEGQVLGTPAYMSPEQARGDAYLADARSDVYSLGVILYQMLTGELPFRGSLRMLLHQVINENPPAPHALDAGVPKDLNTICLKCLEKEPSRRYDSAGHLSADLRRFLEGRPIEARPVGRLAHALSWAKRNKIIAGSLAAAVVTLLGATTISSYFWLRAEENAARADQQAAEATENLYESLLQEIRLTLELREQGYGEKILDLIQRARTLPSARVDRRALSRLYTQSLGDFAAEAPTVLAPPGPGASAIAINADGTETAVGLRDGRMYCFHLADQAPHELDPFAGQVQSIKFSQGGAELIAADKTGEVRFWDRVDGRWKLRKSSKFELRKQPESVVLSPHGELVAHLSGSSIEISNTRVASKLVDLESRPDWTLRSIAFDVARGRAIGGFMNNQEDTVGWVRWSLETGEQLQHIVLPGLGGTYANAIALDAEGHGFVIGFDESLLSYQSLEAAPLSLSGMDATKAVAMCPTAPLFAATNIRGRITIRHSVTLQELASLNHLRLESSRDDLAFSANGASLASSNSNSIHVWNLAGANERKVLPGHIGGVPSVAFHANGRILASGGKDNQIRIWDSSTGRELDEIDAGQPVQALSYSPDSETIAVGCFGKQGESHLKLIDTATRTTVHEQASNVGDVHSLSLCSRTTRKLLAVCGPEGVGLFDYSAHDDHPFREVISLKRHWCLAITLNRSGSKMVWAEEDNNLRGWDILSNRELPLNAPRMLQGWHGLGFLPDGESIIYVSKSGAAEIWNTAQDRHVRTIGREGAFSAPHLAVSFDGAWLAALSQPDTVSIWHVPTGREAFLFRPLSSSVWSLSWDQSGRRLAIGQSDGGLSVWDLEKVQSKLAEVDLAWDDQL